QVLQAGWFERLDDHRRVAVVPAGLRERAQQAVFERQSDALVVGGMLGLRVDADLAILLARLALDEVDDLFERRDLEAAVELLAPFRDRLDGAELLDLGQREVAGPEAVGGLAVEHDGAL